MNVLKNNIILLTVVCLTFLSCSKENEISNQANKYLDISKKVNRNYSELSTLLRTNNVKIDTEKSNLIAENVFSIKKEILVRKESFNITINQKTEIENLLEKLNNSESPEEAYSVLEENFIRISESNLSDNDKNLILSFNIGIKNYINFLENNQDLLPTLLEDGLFGKTNTSWWTYAKRAFRDLTDDLVGTLAVGIMPGPCLLAIGIGATYNYITQK